MLPLLNSNNRADITRFTVRFVSDFALIADAEEVIRGGFRKILGNEVLVDFQRMPEIPRTAGGKYMTALSELAD